MKRAGNPILRIITIMILTTWMGTVLARAQEAAPADAQALLKKVQELQQQLAAQQQQNRALQRQLEQLQTAVAALADAQQVQAKEIQGIPAAVARKSPFKPKGKEVVSVSGFISASYIAQDTKWAFSNGQNGQFPIPPEYTDNKWSSGGDVRNTRLTLGFKGPDLANGWRAGATLEADFFGGFNGAGAFSHQQLTPRIRLGYIDLTKGRTTYRFGQAWSPMFGEFPQSLTHVAFPLGWGSAGGFGWRFPGLYVYHDLTPDGGHTKTQLQVGVFEGSWSGPGNNVNMETAGNVAFRPQVEARLNLAGKTAAGSPWHLYVVGHWDDKDLKGPNNINPSLTGTGLEIGGGFKTGRLTVHGNAYLAKAMGQQLTAITQFGDIQDWGGWLQLGYNVTERWSLWGFYGVADPDDQDVLEWVGPNGRVKNQQYHLMLRYGVGQYALSVEWLHDLLKTGPESAETEGNQIAVSAMYKF